MSLCHAFMTAKRGAAPHDERNFRVHMPCNIDISQQCSLADEWLLIICASMPCICDSKEQCSTV